MRLNEIDFNGLPPIDGYGPGFFRVNGEVIEGNIIMAPTGAKPWGGWEDLDTIIAHSGDLDVLFLGMGAEVGYPPKEAQEKLTGAGIAFEQMATPAACRTYNVLLSEGRRVGAVLIAV